MLNAAPSSEHWKVAFASLENVKMADAVVVTRGGRVTIVVAGAVLSTVTAIAAVVATLPALSVARASSAYDPSAGCALHETVQSVVRRVLPCD